MRALLFTIFLSLFLMQPAPAAYYVAPYGTAAGDGSADNPRTLAWAMNSAPAGSTVWLIPGTYKEAWVNTASSVTYRSLPGTRARLDGSLTISGAGVTVRNLEITDTSWTDRAAPTPAQQVRTVSVAAQNVTIEDSYIHDLAGGIYTGNGTGGLSAGLVIRNNLFYHIGWGSQLGRGNGHAIYIQNDSVGEKLIEGNVLVNQYGFGVHAYGSSNMYARLERMTFDGNVQVNNRWLVGGGRPLKDIAIRGNRLWNSQMQVGYTNHLNEDVTITDNWIGLARLQVQWVYTPTVRLNRIAAPANGQVVYLCPPYGGGIWDANAYYKPVIDNPFAIDGQGFYSLAQWHAITGWDTTSTFTPTLPLENWTDVRATTPHHGHVAIYNWTNAPTVTLDLTSLSITPGATYKLVNAQNTAEHQAFVAGAPVAVPMAGWTVATPYGASAPLAAWDSRFAVFLVEP